MENPAKKAVLSLLTFWRKPTNFDNQLGLKSSSKWGDFMTNLTFDWQIDEFMIYCQSKQLRPKTMQSYEQALRLFARWCEEERHIEAVDKVKEADIRHYLKDVQQRGKYTVYEGISTHSFRKWYATEIYTNSGYDIALVQRLLQHSSAATTQRYIGIEPQRIEQAIEGHAKLL